MEEHLKVSQQKVRQLKENEGILTNKLRRMQSELLEFQKALLKSHNLPLHSPLLPAPQGHLAAQELRIKQGRSC